jgi:hypothetical protein
MERMRRRQPISRNGRAGVNKRVGGGRTYRE